MLIDATAVVRLREGGEQRMREFTSFVMSPATWPVASSGGVGAWRAWAKAAEADWVSRHGNSSRATVGSHGIGAAWACATQAMQGLDMAAMKLQGFEARGRRSSKTRMHV